MAARGYVAVTRDDEGDGAVRRALEDAGFVAISCPVIVEGPPPDPNRLTAIARNLERFDWVICASVRAVRAVTAARGRRWPRTVRTAAVGAVTAAAMREAGAAAAVVGESFNAQSLWQALRSREDWRGQRVLIPAVAGGRRELIEGLRQAGAEVTELEAYAIRPRPDDEIRQCWAEAHIDAVIVGSAVTARRLVEAVGVDAMRELKAIIAIGPTTQSALTEFALPSRIPREATFLAAVEELKTAIP